MTAPAPRLAIGTRGASSNLDHLEIFLPRPTVRTPPRQRHIVPTRARLEPFLGQPLLLVIDESADQTHPALVASALYRFFHFSSCRLAAHDHFKDAPSLSSRASGSSISRHACRSSSDNGRI